MSEEQTSETPAESGQKPTIRGDLKKLKKVAKRAAILGAILGVICPMIPPKYQAPCHTAASFITGCTGALP